VRIVRPEPDWATVPEPVIALLIVKFALAFRLKTKAALSTTLPLPKLPVAPPLPICKVPLLIVVVPLNVLELVRVTEPPMYPAAVPLIDNPALAAPLITPERTPAEA
jgi:hypothetical protein